ncbi:MAG TPA: PEP-CTERM sorting domain-containing protein [Phycisphaerales bacterium]|nr:PEP-CTERM sorting domain-containing protein [Phycisphaerales bacterium]
MKTASILALVLTAGAAVAQHNPANATVYGGSAGQGQDFGNFNQRDNVIYSSLSNTDNQNYNVGNGNAYSGRGAFGFLYDLQLCDDFTTTSDNVITHVTADFLTFFGGTPADGLQVDIFTDNGGTPSEGAIASVTVPVTAASSFSDTIFGLAGRRLGADVNIPLAANTSYFIMIQPIDLSSGGDWYYQVGNNGETRGGETHLRDGGRGNPGYGVSTWTAYTSYYGTTNTTSMEIRATIPAPSALAVLGLGGLAAARRRR